MCDRRRVRDRRSGRPRKQVMCSFWGSLSIDELARAQKIRPVKRLEDLSVPIWGSSEELEQFLAGVYAARSRRKTDQRD